MSLLEAQVHPESTALLVVDMQNDFCAEGGYLQRERGYNVGFAPALADRIQGLVRVARTAGMPVVWIRSVYDFKYLNEPYRVKRRDEGCCLEGTWGVEFFRLRPEPGEPIVTKHHYSAFFETDLHAQLQSLGVKTLVVTGVATNVCVDSTLREGFFRGYYIVVPEDCVNSNSKAGHEGTLATVRNNIGIVCPSEDIIQILTAPR
ncbi:MAG: cysteine hydrolase [Alcaligenaceae bacterium]|nr:cysteine hydrolase [Alcaligenaceae bacterium]